MIYTLNYDYVIDYAENTAVFNDDEITLTDYAAYDQDDILQDIADGIDFVSENGSFYYKITENIRDIVHYLFYKKYNKKFNDLSWFLEEGARDFVKDIEHQWWKNEFDSFKLYHDDDFLEFLKDEYMYEAERQFIDEVIN